MTEPARQVRIALVGHCGPDSYALRSSIGSAVPEAEVVFVNDEPGAIAAAGSADLLMVNRVLDGDFVARDGIELIGKLAAGGSARVMLISNLSASQAEAEKAGAVAGFGKTTMYAAESHKRIREALAAR